VAEDTSFTGLITGGLREYLDIAAYRELSEIDRKPLAQETQTYVKQDGPNTLEGYPSVPTVAGINALVLIGGGLIAVALIFAVLRR
jgi:hypothetical protein